MAVLTIVALDYRLERNDKVFILGEEVAQYVQRLSRKLCSISFNGHIQV